MSNQIKEDADTGSGNGATVTSEEIAELYVLLKENYRISRNIRMVWFFNNILKDISILPHINPENKDSIEKEEIQVLSWCSKSNVHETKDSATFVIQPSTRVHFLSRGYRLVFALDLSPSAFQVSIKSQSTVVENILSNLADCLCSLVKPVQVPHCEVELSPNIFVTVFVQTLHTELGDGRYKQDVIVQSCLLTPKTIATILTKVERKVFHDFVARKSEFVDQSSAKHDHGLVNMLRAGLLALQLLPSNTSAGLVVITDCITGVPDMAVLETLVNHLRSSSTTCSVIHVSPSCSQSSYAYCPNIELFKFITRATYGTFIVGRTSCEGDESINDLHKALLFWKFQTMDTSSGKDVRSWHIDVDLRYTPDQKNMKTTPLLRKKQFERTMRVSMYSVLTVRLREGYQITSVYLKKNNSQLEVELIYPWNHSASLKYIASSTWPNPKNQTKVEVYIDGTYEFLSDMSMSVNGQNCSRYKDAVWKRFTQFVKGLSHIDHMLTHLMTFEFDSDNLGPVENRLPLFYLPPNSNQLVLSMQSETDSSKSPFVVYWKPILSLDTGIWQKWLHTHHIDLVLRHDMPLPKHLHTPSRGGRYHSIQCSSTMSLVTSILREWCTFILLENHTYIKIIKKKNEEKPSSFYIIRLSNKLPVLIIRLAFLIGTSGSFRNRVLAELREKILSVSQNSTSSSRPALSRQLSSRTRHFSMQMTQRSVRSPEKPRVVQMHKPLDRILIRYEQSPKDFMLPPTHSQRFSKNTPVTRQARNMLGGEIAPSSMMLNPCKYLDFERNVWSVTNSVLTPLSLPIVSQIATLLVKLRLSEGYHFASSYSGIVAMVKEYPATYEHSQHGLQYCLSQYIIFPPTTYTHESRYSASSVGSDGEENEDEPDRDGELFLATECWIEPQFGHIIDDKLQKSTRKISPMPLFPSPPYSTSEKVDVVMSSSMGYKDVPYTIFERDLKFLTVVVTLEHLRLMCAAESGMSKALPQYTELTRKNGEATKPCKISSDGFCHSCGKDRPTINMHPCLFDLIALLDRCPRVKLSFTTLSQDKNLLPSDTNNPNKYLFDHFHSSIKKHSHCDPQLSESDCAKITEHLMKRENLNLNSETNVKKVKWKCFLKVVPKATVIITLMPASMEDLMIFLEFFKELDNINSDNEKVDNSTKSKSADNEAFNRNDSTVDGFEATKANPKFSRRQSLIMNSISGDKFDFETVDKEHLQSFVLPVFVYECITSAVTESLLKDPTHLPTDIDLSAFNVEDDHRIKVLDDDTQTETPRPKLFRSLSFPMKRSQHLSSADDTISEEETLSPDSFPSSPDTHSKIFHETLVHLYHSCFVRAVLSALRKNEGKGVASADVQAATDAICVESVQEINITKFLLLTCPQVAAFKTECINRVSNMIETDEVFTSGAIHLPVSQRDAITRHASSTSSNAEVGSSKLSSNIARSSSDSGDQTTRGNANQISKLKFKIKTDDVKNEKDSSGRFSAFKKPRRRPQSLPKVCDPERKTSDTDGDTPDMEKRSFRPIVADEAQQENITFSLDAGLHGKPVAVGTPLKKLTVISKVDWADLPDFPLNLLKETHPRHISGTDDQVQVKFLELLSENFHPVHSVPDIYFLKNEKQRLSDSDIDDDDDAWTSDHQTFEVGQNDAKSKGDSVKVTYPENEMSSLPESHDDSTLLRDELEVVYSEDGGLLGSMNNINRSYAECLSASSLSISNADEAEYDDKRDTPLFLCITCTVRDKKTGNHGTALVQKIPIKLGEVLSYLEEQNETIGLSDLSVTLDLIWMVLPPDVEIPEDDSLLESRFTSGLLPDDDESPRHHSAFIKQRSHYLNDDQELKDPLSTVSKHTRNTIDHTRREIGWLLEDETISAIRACESIDSNTLEEVTQHIENSSKDNCVMQELMLKFVFGPGKSIKPFTELFEQKFNRFKGYQLRAAGRFYYLVMERTFLPIPNWPNEPFTESHFTAKDLEQYTDTGNSASHLIRLIRQSKTSQDSKEVTPERTVLKKTKSSNDSSQSPPVKQMRVVKSCVSLRVKGDSAMSVDAIESDVGSTRQSVSAQSTPIRKTMSAFDTVTTYGTNLGDSQDVQVNFPKYARGSHPRRSLPITPTVSIGQSENNGKTDKKKPPIAQRSFDSNLNMADKFNIRQHTTTGVRLSPLFIGSASPSAGKTSGSVRLSRRRSANSTTPVSQLAHSETSGSAEPNSSTPLMKSDGPLPSDQMAAAFSNSPYLLNSAIMKEVVSSPVSLSDGEPHRYSTASCLESGYEGEVSDSDGDDCFMRSLDERSDLPNFWVIVEIKDDKAKIFSHRRSSSTSTAAVSEQDRVFKFVKNYITEACTCVNQKLLLLELHDTRTCNPLLLEETEEDIWNNDDHYTTFGVHDDHADDIDGALLADAMTTAPGQFQCECVHEKTIPLHPRLKMTVGVKVKATVVGLVRQLMTNLMVMNRKDMFVYQLTDKSVYYCRMSEDPGILKSDSRRSSQLISDSYATEVQDRRMSKDSNAGDLKSAGTLILRWYGIGPLSSQQEQELQKMNDSVVRRFNESIMEKMTVILQRNSKLSPHDVLFIQPTIPSDSSTLNANNLNYSRQVLPNVTLSYCLSEEFTCCISAVKYYLHQNLLQFTAWPKYVDSSQPATHFIAYRMKGGEDHARKYAQHEGSVYLFHQMREPGKTGFAIACIVLEISDIEGNATPTYSQTKFQPPDQKSYEEIVKLTEVTGYQETFSTPQGSRCGTPAMMEPLPFHSPLPAPGNYVRFHLWLNGSIPGKDLHDRLQNAVRHALFDAITELFVLRPPLSGFEFQGKGKEDVLTPMDYQKSKRGQARFPRKLSLPNHGLAALSKRWSDGDHSSTFLSSASPGKTKSHACVARVRSSPSDGGRTDAMRSILQSLNDPSSSMGRGIFTNLINPKLEQSNKEEDNKGGKTSAFTRRLSSSGAQFADETEVGTLNEMYRKFAQEWFTAMHSVKCASVFQQDMKLSVRSHLKNFVINLQKIVATALPDCKVKVFSHNNHESNPSSVNLEAKKFDQDREIPSRYVSFIIVARNFPLWRKATGQSMYSDAPSYSGTGKFRPYDALVRPDQSPRPQEHRFMTSSSYISRQQFFMISINDGKMGVWGYNISNEISSNLISKLNSCKNFHEAKWRARNCITFQKLGLFRHCSYENGYPTCDNQEKGANPFTRDVRDVDTILTRSDMPNEADRKFQQQRSKSTRRSFFNEAYLHHKPVKPLSASTYDSADTTVQYTKQYLEMKAHFKKSQEEQQVLQKVFNNCRDRSVGAPHNVLTKDTLQILLRHARTIHHVTSPILTCPYFRRRIPQCKSSKADTPVETTPKEPVVQKRSKRFSGSMRKSGDFSGKNSEESRSRSNSAKKEGKGSKNSLQLNTRDSLDNPRYEVGELKKAIVNQYIQYWQSLQFLMVREDRIDKSTKKSGDSKTTKLNQNKSSEEKSLSKSSDVKSEESAYPIYLYRASGGGIVIMEIGFVDMNFSLKLHTIEVTKLQHQSTNKQQLSVHFLNECEHLKDLTHAHSFMFDFHLRYMQMYIQERQTAIRPGYHVVSFLQDFNHYYNNAPDCAVNSIYQGQMMAKCSHVSPDELYEYLVGKQASSLGFKTLKLLQHNEERSEHALVSSHLIFDKLHSGSCNTEEHNAYDIGYVIWFDRKEQEEKKIKLNFFLLFTNRKHVFPRLDRLDDLSQKVFPMRRSSVNPNLTPRTSKLKSSVEHVAQLLAQGRMLPMEGKSKSTTPIRSNSPVQRIASSDVTSSDFSAPTTLGSPGPSDVFLFQDPAVKRTLHSLGRRKSMPTFTAYSSEKKPLPKSNLVSQLWITEKETERYSPQERDSPSFVQCEKSRLSVYLEKICASAEIQCYKDQLWNTVYRDKPLQNQPSSLSIEEFEHLLKHCQMIPLSRLDKRGHVLCNIDTMGIQWAVSLQKQIRAKFDQICRYFVNGGETKRYLGVLNPKLYLMMFLLTVDTEKKEVGMFIVIRDKIAELEAADPDLSSSGNANIVALRGHLNHMLEFVCYHTWTSLFH